MIEKNCPSPAELSGFILGTLPLTDLERVALHLDDCSACDAAVEAIESVSDPVVQAIRESGVDTRLLAGEPEPARSARAPELLGDFRIVREIGRGGMGVVHEAEQVSLGRRVALKILPRHALLDPDALERFRRESRAVAGLHHTNIVQVFGAGEQDGVHYFVMELIPGVGLDRVLSALRRSPGARRPPGAGQAAVPDPSLMAVVRALLSGISSRSGAGESANRDDPPVPAQTLEPLELTSSSGSGRPYWIRVARVALQVAEALAHAHAHGVLHRDIKPSNLLLDYHGTVWVTDFGLAKAVGEEHVLTQTGDVVGTLRYLPPERLDGKSEARGDVYSLGVTLYELATLHDAFPNVDRNVLIRKKLETEPPRPRRVNGRIPRDLETIILKSIARDPVHRYPKAAEMAADLRRFIEDRPVRARRVTAPERLWRWCRRDPRTAGLLGALWLALSAGLLGVAIEWRRAERKARDEAAARIRADLAQEQARADLYLSDIAQARLEWRLGSVARANQLLDHCEPRRRGWEWHYLRGVNRPELANLANPDLSMIFGVGFDPKGRFLAYTGWDYYRNQGGAPTPVEIWDFTTGQKRFTLSAPGVGLRPTFSPDGRLVAFSGVAAPVSIWNLETGKRTRAFEEHGDAAFSADGRCLAIANQATITIREVASGRVERRFASTGGQVRFSPDGASLAQSGRQAVLLRSINTGDELGRLPSRPGDQMDLFFPELGPQIAFSPDGKLLVVATSPTRVWDVATREPLHVLAGHVGVVAGVAIGPDGRRIATGGADGTVRLWDARTGAELAVLRGHIGMVSCVAFHPEGWALMSGGRQPGDVKIWDLTRPVEYQVLGGGGAWDLAFDDHDQLRRINHLGRIQTHDPETGRTEEGPRVDLIQKWLSPARVAAFSGEGRRLATVSSDRRSVKLFDGRDGREITVFNGLESPPRRLALSRDGHRVAAATMWIPGRAPRAVRVWDARSGRLLADLHPAAPTDPSRRHGSVALSTDGRLVAFDDSSAAGVDRPIVRVLDVDSSQEKLVVQAGEGGVDCLAFSPDGSLIAAGGEDGRVLAWETATGRRRCSDYLVLSPLELAFSPDGRRLAAVDREVVSIWDVQTGKSILALRGSPPRPTDLASNAALAWSPNGRWLAAVNWDGSVALWDGDWSERATEHGWFRHAPLTRVYAWHLDEAEAAHAAGQWAAAAFHLDRISALDPPDPSMRQRRGRLRLLRGDWTRARADYEALFDAVEPDSARAWLDHARLLVLRGDHAGYRRLIPRMIAHCGGVSDLGDPEPEEVQASVLAPGGAEDPKALVRFAERAWINSRRSPRSLWSLSVAHYRAGRWDEAIAKANETIARGAETAWLSWPILALAHARLGHTHEARRWLAKAREWSDQERRRQLAESAGFTTPKWTDFEILKREATTAIGGSENQGREE